ncbi:MAG TPA: hypothetical protein VGG45_09845 [Terracidiphilus sp.]|jgi:hypothetical protein
MRVLTAIFVSFLLSAPLAAQKDKPEPLTETQQDQIAEAGIFPVARIGLYIKFIDGYSDAVKGLVPRLHSQARDRRIVSELQNFSALMDELGDNLDVYSERKTDIRKALKPLSVGVARWQQTLKGLPSEPGFELSLKDALDSVTDLSDQARQITSDQEAYFKAHPDEKNQDRAEPK